MDLAGRAQAFQKLVAGGVAVNEALATTGLLGRTVTWIGIAAGVATIVSCVVGVVTYFESPTRTQPPPDSAHPSTAPVEQPEIGGVDDRARTASRTERAWRYTEDDVMLLMYVDESTAARLGSAHGEVGSIFGFFRPSDGHAVLAGLPVRRILDWEHRAGGKDGFAEIQMD